VFSFNKGFKVKVLELARVDSRARASRLHQVLKRNLAHWIKIWTKSRRRKRPSREDFQEDLCHVCKCQDFVFRQNVKDRLVGGLLKFIYTHTQDLYVSL